MPVNIYDNDFMEKIDSVEGKGWCDSVPSNPVNAQGASIPETTSIKAIKVYIDGMRDLMKDDPSPDYDKLVMAILYGKGGYNRYQVLYSGEIIFLRMWGSIRGKEAAKKAGFRLG